MIEPTITCPKCMTDIPLTASLAAPLLEAARREFTEKLLAKDAEVAGRERELHTKELQVAAAKRSVDLQVAEQVEDQLRSQKARLVADESRKAKQAVADQMAAKDRELVELQEVLDQREVKLAAAQQAQAELVRKQRELDDAKRELELTVEMRVQEGLTGACSQARREAEEGMTLRLRDREHTISSMQKTIDELKRKLEQGSQQMQGEVQELQLEAMLRAKFPYDSVDPVPKGEFGGDTLQRVVSPSGAPCGTILWECKRTKNWSDTWLTKLRDDQRTAKADVAVLVTHALPKGIETFELVDGIWVVHPRVALPLAAVLRCSLIEVSTSRQVNIGLKSKAELVYQYLTGPHFRQRVEAIVEAFSTMREELDNERKVITRLWAKRETQIDRVMDSTVGMYGDLQGIAGKSVLEIGALELPALV